MNFLRHDAVGNNLLEYTPYRRAYNGFLGAAAACAMFGVIGLILSDMVEAPGKMDTDVWTLIVFSPCLVFALCLVVLCCCGLRLRRIALRSVSGAEGYDGDREPTIQLAQVNQEMARLAEVQEEGYPGPAYDFDDIDIGEGEGEDMSEVTSISAIDFDPFALDTDPEESVELRLVAA